MKLYSTLPAFDAYNVGFLAGIRGSASQASNAMPLATPEELEAWNDGFSDGKTMRVDFDPSNNMRREAFPASRNASNAST